MSELRVALTIAALVLAMVLAVAVGLRHRIGAVLLSLLSIVWLLVDQFFEGPDLVEITKAHGLVASDLVGLAGLLVSVALWVRLHRRAVRG